MNVIPLLSDEDKDLLRYSWSLRKTGYCSRHTSRDGEKFRISAHQEVIERVTGKIPRRAEGLVIDHINGNKIDNRRENLRVVSICINTSNSPRTRAAKYIVWDEKAESWQVQPSVCGTPMYLGQVKDRAEAEALSVAFRDYVRDFVRPMFMKRGPHKKAV